MKADGGLDMPENEVITIDTEEEAAHLGEATSIVRDQIRQLLEHQEADPLGWEIDHYACELVDTLALNGILLVKVVD